MHHPEQQQKVFNLPHFKRGTFLNGFAHARDLIYVNKLVKSYHTEERVMMTLQLAEKCGINTLMAIPGNMPILDKYRRETGGKIQFISDCGWAILSKVPNFLLMEGQMLAMHRVRLPIH